MSWTSNNTIPNYQISRHTISKKIKSINYNYNMGIYKKGTPTTLYTETDEVHANLQKKKDETKKKNKIVPVIIVHEGNISNKKINLDKYVTSFKLRLNQLTDYNNRYNFETYIDNSQFNLQDNANQTVFLIKVYKNISFYILYIFF